MIAVKLSANCFQARVQSINLRKTIENTLMYVIGLIQACFNHRETLKYWLFSNIWVWNFHPDSGNNYCEIENKSLGNFLRSEAGSQHFALSMGDRMCKINPLKCPFADGTTFFIGAKDGPGVLWPY